MKTVPASAEHRLRPIIGQLDIRESVMNTATQESAPATMGTTRDPQTEFSQKYSRGELEEMDSRELLDGYAR